MILSVLKTACCFVAGAAAGNVTNKVLEDLLMTGSKSGGVKIAEGMMLGMGVTVISLAVGGFVTKQIRTEIEDIESAILSIINNEDMAKYNTKGDEGDQWSTSIIGLTDKLESTSDSYVDETSNYDWHHPTKSWS